MEAMYSSLLADTREEKTSTLFFPSFSLCLLSCYGIVCCVIQTVQTQQPLRLESHRLNLLHSPSWRRRQRTCRHPCPVRRRLLGVTFRQSLELARWRYLLAPTLPTRWWHHQSLRPTPLCPDLSDAHWPGPFLGGT